MSRNLRKIQRGNPTGSGDPLRSTAGGSPPASSPATVTREGYEERVLSDSETNFSWSVTIPSNTTAIVLVSASYGFYSGNPLVSAYLDLETDQNFTVDANIDGTNDAGIGIGH